MKRSQIFSGQSLFGAPIEGGCLFPRDIRLMRNRAHRILRDVGCQALSTSRNQRQTAWNQGWTAMKNTIFQQMDHKKLANHGKTV